MSLRKHFGPHLYIAAMAVAVCSPLPAQEPEEPCLLDLSLRPLTVSRDVVLLGNSSRLDWSVTFPINPACANRVSVFLVHGGVSEKVNDVGPRTLSPTQSTTYRLKAVDRLQTNPRLREQLLGDPITVTVLQPPPTPPKIDCP